MADGGEFEIEIGTQGRFKRSYLESNPSKATGIYRYAKDKKHIPICRCVEHGVKMQISHLTLHDTYVLKRRANSGKSHHVDCWSHGEAQKSKSSTDYVAALITKEDGTQDIKVDVPIAFSSNSSTPKPSTPTPRSNQTQRMSTSLAGFFEHIWFKAGFLAWEPDMERPNYKTIRDRIQDVFRGEDSCNNHSINEILYIPYYEKWITFCNLLKSKAGYSDRGQADRRIVILGLVNALTPNAHGFTLKLNTIQDSVSFYINNDTTINRLTSSLPCVDGSHKYDPKHDGYFWFIGTAFPRAKKDPKNISPLIDEGVIVPVSKEHVPLDIVASAEYLIGD